MRATSNSVPACTSKRKPSTRVVRRVPFAIGPFSSDRGCQPGIGFGFQRTLFRCKRSLRLASATVSLDNVGMPETFVIPE